MGFYKERDNLVGGSDSAWRATADFDPDDVATKDMESTREGRAGSVLSQSDLASPASDKTVSGTIYGS